MKDQLKDCLPVLTRIFVNWKWLLISICSLFVTVSAISFQSGRIIAAQDNRIRTNTQSFENIEVEMGHLKSKIDFIDKKLDSILVIIKVRK